MYWKFEPAGTVTVSEPTAAEDTMAGVAPKYTMLSVGVVLNPLPVIVTKVPTGPETGEKEAMVWAFRFCTQTKIQQSKPPTFKN